MSHRYDAHGRLIAIPSRPAEVTLASVIAVDDTFAVSAAVASTHRDAFRSRVMVVVRREIIVTNATIRADAVTVLATPFANRLAEAVVPRREAVMARAAIRSGARAVGAPLAAKGYANTVRVLRVTVVANANARFVARRVIPTRECVAGRFEASRTNVPRVVVQGLAQFDPRRIELRIAGAYVWRGAQTVDAVEIANRLADTGWHYHAKHFPIILVQPLCMWVHLLISFEASTFIERRAIPIGFTRHHAL